VVLTIRIFKAFVRRFDTWRHHSGNKSVESCQWLGYKQLQPTQDNQAAVKENTAGNGHEVSFCQLAPI